MDVEKMRNDRIEISCNNNTNLWGLRQKLTKLLNNLRMKKLFSNRNKRKAATFQLRVSDKKGSELTETARSNLMIEHAHVKSTFSLGYNRILSYGSLPQRKRKYGKGPFTKSVRTFDLLGIGPMG